MESVRGLLGDPRERALREVRVAMAGVSRCMEACAAQISVRARLVRPEWWESALARAGISEAASQMVLVVESGCVRDRMGGGDAGRDGMALMQNAADSWESAGRERAFSGSMKVVRMLE